MNEQEQENKIEEYSQRHQFWTNQALTQFGYSINLFTTIGIAFLAYLIKLKREFPPITINPEMSIDWNLVLFMIALVFSFFTVALGLISVTGRLYDIRITRHLIWTRKRAVKSLKKYMPDGFIDLTKDSIWSNYFKTLFRKIDFITSSDLENFETAKPKFNNLRKQSKLLGELSWRTHKFQLVTLMISVIIYGIT